MQIETEIENRTDNNIMLLNLFRNPIIEYPKNNINCKDVISIILQLSVYIGALILSINLSIEDVVENVTYNSHENCVSSCLDSNNFVDVYSFSSIFSNVEMRSQGLQKDVILSSKSYVQTQGYVGSCNTYHNGLGDFSNCNEPYLIINLIENDNTVNYEVGNLLTPISEIYNCGFFLVNGELSKIASRYGTCYLKNSSNGVLYRSLSILEPMYIRNNRLIGINTIIDTIKYSNFTSVTPVENSIAEFTQQNKSLKINMIGLGLEDNILSVNRKTNNFKYDVVRTRSKSFQEVIGVFITILSSSVTISSMIKSMFS
jgi:hypothetical protein